MFEIIRLPRWIKIPIYLLLLLKSTMFSIEEFFWHIYNINTDYQSLLKVQSHRIILEMVNPFPFLQFFLNNLTPAPIYNKYEFHKSFKTKMAKRCHTKSTRGVMFHLSTIWGWKIIVSDITEENEDVLPSLFWWDHIKVNVFFNKVYWTI